MIGFQSGKDVILNEGCILYIYIYIYIEIHSTLFGFPFSHILINFAISCRW